jgi:hypothetical protein
MIPHLTPLARSTFAHVLQVASLKAQIDQTIKTKQDDTMENVVRAKGMTPPSLRGPPATGSENFVLNTVCCCGVSIGESLEQKRRVRAVKTWAIVPF